MNVFLVSSDGGEVRRAVDQGLIQGVALDRACGAPSEALAGIAAATRGPVLVPLSGDGAEAMMRSGAAAEAVAPNIVAAVDVSDAGLAVVRARAADRRRTLVSGCVSLAQALQAARAGASWVSCAPQGGGLAQAGPRGQDGEPDATVGSFHGPDAVRKMHGLFRTFGLATEVLAFADHPEDALDLAAAGAQVLAVGAGVLHRLGGRGRAAVVRGEAPADSDRQARLRVSRS